MEQISNMVKATPHRTLAVRQYIYASRMSYRINKCPDLHEALRQRRSISFVRFKKNFHVALLRCRKA